MSAWHSEIREEGVKWACFAEGGIRDPRMEHTMAASYQEARDWVDAAYIRKTTPKVKKPVEPVEPVWSAPIAITGLSDEAVAAHARLVEHGWVDGAPDEVAETATGDQAGSAMPSAVESVARETFSEAKTRADAIVIGTTGVTAEMLEAPAHRQRLIEPRALTDGPARQKRPYRKRGSAA